MVIGNGMNMAKWILPTLALGAMLCACFESGKDVAGTSEESEGVIALEGKMISGVAQKGPLVKGSSVVLRETSADGKLEPTGRKFETTTIDDKGRFGIDSVELESPYVLLSAEGYYTREADGERSRCPMRLDAVTSLENRKVSNINLLTHFEYKRVLNLVKSGKAFAEAKKQAATEVLGAFGVSVKVDAAENLNIYSTTDGDRTLYNLSAFIDNRAHWRDNESGNNLDCSKLQRYIDGFAEDYADDGKLSDSIMSILAGSVYDYFYGCCKLLEGETDQEYQFRKLLFMNYMGVENCTESLWGEYRKFERPIEVFGKFNWEILDSGYLLCDGSKWTIRTAGYIDSLKMKIDHESGTMTDPRDGKTYNTVSFVFDGIKYEWMAEDLKYRAASGLCSWTTALQIDKKYMKKPVEDGLIDSVHQGLCPDGWHVANSKEWADLIGYVRDGTNLLNEGWRQYGVFYDKFDFNLKVPTGEKTIEIFYHTYAHKSYFVENLEDKISEFGKYYEGTNEEWALDLVVRYRNIKKDNVAYGISADGAGNAWVKPLESAFVRCVKN